LTPKWPWLRSREKLINFGTPYIFGIIKGTNFTFGAHIEYDMY